MSDVGRGIAAPAVCYVQCDNTLRVLVLTAQAVVDDGLEISRAGVGFWPDAAQFAWIVFDQKEVT